MAWNASGLITDPATDDVLADTGAVLAGVLNLTVMLWSDTYCLIDLVQRNAANTADVKVQALQTTGDITVFTISVTLLLNQRIILRNRLAITNGSMVSASLIG